MERGHMETKNAEIALVSIVHKITNLITSMDFIQSDAVSDTAVSYTHLLSACLSLAYEKEFNRDRFYLRP